MCILLKIFTWTVCWSNYQVYVLACYPLLHRGKHKILFRRTYLFWAYTNFPYILMEITNPDLTADSGKNISL